MTTIVEEHLDKTGIPYSRVFHRPAETALEEASSLRWGSEDVLKGVLIDSNGERVLAIVPATRQLDLEKVRKVLRDPHARLTPPEEVEADYRGPLPPIASLVGADKELVDLEVFDHRAVYVAGGDVDRTVEMFLEDLLRDRPVTGASITRPLRPLPAGS